MPAYAAKMSDQQIADVTTFIRNAWGNAAPVVSAAQVAKARRTK
jgi:mono/diheme cytochrome c family protein